MIKCGMAVGVVFGALLGVSAQATPLNSEAAMLQGQVQSETIKVAHCRAWSGGWNCAPIYRPWHNRYRSHWRWGSRNRNHWRWGSRRY